MGSSNYTGVCWKKEAQKWVGVAQCLSARERGSLPASLQGKQKLQTNSCTEEVDAASGLAKIFYKLGRRVRKCFPLSASEADALDSMSIEELMAQFRKAGKLRSTSKSLAASADGKTSAYRGVYFNTTVNKWKVEVYLAMDNFTLARRTHLGYFEEELDAALFYDWASIALGLTQRLNFPDKIAQAQISDALLIKLFGTTDPVRIEGMTGAATFAATLLVHWEVAAVQGEVAACKTHHTELVAMSRQWVQQARDQVKYPSPSVSSILSLFPAEPFAWLQGSKDLVSNSDWVTKDRYLLVDTLLGQLLSFFQAHPQDLTQVSAALKVLKGALEYEKLRPAVCLDKAWKSVAPELAEQVAEYFVDKELNKLNEEVIRDSCTALSTIRQVDKDLMHMGNPEVICTLASRLVLSSYDAVCAKLPLPCEPQALKDVHNELMALHASVQDTNQGSLLSDMITDGHLMRTLLHWAQPCKHGQTRNTNNYMEINVAALDVIRAIFTSEAAFGPHMVIAHPNNLLMVLTHLANMFVDVNKELEVYYSAWVANVLSACFFKVVFKSPAAFATFVCAPGHRLFQRAAHLLAASPALEKEVTMFQYQLVHSLTLPDHLKGDEASQEKVLDELINTGWTQVLSTMLNCNTSIHSSQSKRVTCADGLIGAADDEKSVTAAQCLKSVCETVIHLLSFTYPRMQDACATSGLRQKVFQLWHLKLVVLDEHPFECNEVGCSHCSEAAEAKGQPGREHDQQIQQQQQQQQHKLQRPSELQSGRPEPPPQQQQQSHEGPPHHGAHCDTLPHNITHDDDHHNGTQPSHESPPEQGQHQHPEDSQRQHQHPEGSQHRHQLELAFKEHKQQQMLEEDIVNQQQQEWTPDPLQMQKRCREVAADTASPDQHAAAGVGAAGAPTDLSVSGVGARALIIVGQGTHISLQGDDDSDEGDDDSDGGDDDSDVGDDDSDGGDDDSDGGDDDSDGGIGREAKRVKLEDVGEVLCPPLLPQGLH